MPKTWQRGLFNQCPGRKPGIGVTGENWNTWKINCNHSSICEHPKMSSTNQSCDLSDGTLRSEPSQTMSTRLHAQTCISPQHASKRCFPFSQKSRSQLQNSKCQNIESQNCQIKLTCQCGHLKQVANANDIDT